MKNSRILITGGAGLIGPIADLLVDKDVAEIVVIDNFVRGRHENLATALARKPITIIDGDIGDPELLAEVMPGIDIIFIRPRSESPSARRSPGLPWTSL